MSLQDFKKRIKEERGNISEYIIAIAILIGLLLYPFMVSYQLFTYNKTKTAAWTAAGLEMKTLEGGYKEDYSKWTTKKKSDLTLEIRDSFIKNLEGQGVDVYIPPTRGVSQFESSGKDVELKSFTVTPISGLPIVRMQAQLRMKVPFLRWMLGDDDAYINIDVVSRRQIG